MLAHLFLYSNEDEFLDSIIRSDHRILARSFNLYFRYIDDLIIFDNKKFSDYLIARSPSQGTVEKAYLIRSPGNSSSLDLTFAIGSSGKLSTKLYEDNFDFHIVNFPLSSGNIPSGPSDNVCILQLIR